MFQRHPSPALNQEVVTMHTALLTRFQAVLRISALPLFFHLAVAQVVPASAPSASELARYDRNKNGRLAAGGAQPLPAAARAGGTRRGGPPGGSPQTPISINLRPFSLRDSHATASVPEINADALEGDFDEKPSGLMLMPQTPPGSRSP
jgi:hypothetical protein